MSFNNESISFDEQTLQAAVMYASAGEPIEDVCAYINPKYRSWSSGKRKAYEASVRAAIDGRQRGQSGQNSASRMTIDSMAAYETLETEPAAAKPEPPPMPAETSAPSGFTRGQILMLVAIFVLAVALFTTLLRRMG